jgi:hypothetical protein
VPGLALPQRRRVRFNPVDLHFVHAAAPSHAPARYCSRRSTRTGN